MTPRKSLYIHADDRLARFTFSDPARTAGLIDEFLPEDLVACLDLSSLRLIEDQHIDNNLRERRDDLNMECHTFPHGKVLIRILLEHKSDFDSSLWFQLSDSITGTWKRSGFCPVIPIVLHTGPARFRFASPQAKFHWMRSPILQALPALPIYPIDLASCSMDRIAQSTKLDAIAKVILQIMKLVQLGHLDVRSIREVIRNQFPGVASDTQREYLGAAINYIQYKAPLGAELVETLRSDMALAHSINPKSAFAQELREERERGISQGISTGILRIQVAAAKRMLSQGYDWHQIELILDLSEAKYHELTHTPK